MSQTAWRSDDTSLELTDTEISASFIIMMSMIPEPTAIVTGDSGKPLTIKLNRNTYRS